MEILNLNCWGVLLDVLVCKYFDDRQNESIEKKVKCFEKFRGKNDFSFIIKLLCICVIFVLG